MDNVNELLMFYVGKSFYDKSKKVFNLGVVVKKPLLQILKSLGFNPTDMSSDEAEISRGVLEDERDDDNKRSVP